MICMGYNFCLYAHCYTSNGRLESQLNPVCTVTEQGLLQSTVSLSDFQVLPGYATQRLNS